MDSLGLSHLTMWTKLLFDELHCTQERDQNEWVGGWMDEWRVDLFEMRCVCRNLSLLVAPFITLSFALRMNTKHGKKKREREGGGRKDRKGKRKR
jgi:hypothetical protein